MTASLQIGLRAGERLYLNGAVVRVDRKVRLELLNDATFLLGSHVMQQEDATTPLRQLYFLVQGMLMDPSVAASLRPAIEVFVATIGAVFATGPMHEELPRVARLIDDGRSFEALKLLRGLVVQERTNDRIAARPLSHQLEVEA